MLFLIFEIIFNTFYRIEWHIIMWRESERVWIFFNWIKWYDRVLSTFEGWKSLLCLHQKCLMSLRFIQKKVKLIGSVFTLKLITNHIYAWVDCLVQSIHLKSMLNCSYVSMIWLVWPRASITKFVNWRWFISLILFMIMRFRGFFLRLEMLPVFSFYLWKLLYRFFVLWLRLKNRCA